MIPAPMPPRVLIILGSPNDDQGKLGEIALLRCETALALAADTPDALFLPTGGFGAHFNTTATPHWRYLASHLVRAGVNESRILGGAESLNTLQDAYAALAVLRARFPAPASPPPVTVVTSRYHLARAEYVFAQVFASDVPHVFVAAPNPAPSEELDALKAHEARALPRLRENPDLFANARAALAP